MNKNDYEAIKKTAIKALNSIDPRKPHGTELFNAIARISVSVAIETVCLRLNHRTQKIEVFLTQRSLNDVYLGEWHSPGSIMRPGEEFSDVFKRLAEKEFSGRLLLDLFVGNLNNTREARGHFLQIIYLCITDGTAGTWYPVDALPEKTVSHHREYVIPMAVKTFIDSRLKK